MLHTFLLILIVFCGCVASVSAGPWRASEGNVYGWQLMAPDERIEHQRQLRSFDTYDACKQYLAEHHAELEARADRLGVVLRPRRRPACDELRAAGRLK